MAAASRSKRKDGMTQTQALVIYKQVNSFFTFKWPHVIALILASAQTKLDYTAHLKTLAQTIQAKFKSLLAHRGVKQHALVRSQFVIHEALT